MKKEEKEEEEEADWLLLHRFSAVHT